jgi:F-type H+-transporting ATPase subunit a
VTLYTALTVLPLATSDHEGSGGGFHAPSISEFFPPAIFGEGTFFEFNRIMLVRVIVTAALILLLWLATRNAKLVPARAQNLVELGLHFVRVEVAEQIMGHNGKRFVPMITTIFFGVFAMNVAGIIPGLNIAGTSVVGLPVLLALWVYFTYLWAGVAKQGLGGYLKSSLFPPGIPWFMYILITPIEALQVFVFRPLTLALRLLANMIAGHLMLVLCFSATSFLLLEGGGLIPVTSALTFVAGLGITLFELVVAALQAYIFALLSAVYLNLAVEAEH